MKEEEEDIKEERKKKRLGAEGKRGFGKGGRGEDGEEEMSGEGKERKSNLLAFQYDSIAHLAYDSILLSTNNILEYCSISYTHKLSYNYHYIPTN